MFSTNRVAEMRIAAGITQQDLAKTSLVAQGTLSQIERGMQIPNVYYAIALAHALHTDVETLFPYIRKPWGEGRRRHENHAGTFDTRGIGEDARVLDYHGGD